MKNSHPSSKGNEESNSEFHNTKSLNKNFKQFSSSILITEQLSKINYQSLSALESTLKDQYTFSTYMKVIQDNTHQFHNKTVMHLTTDCNCLYSIFAAQAGAKKVYCILNGHSQTQHKNMYMMERMIEENGFNKEIIQVKLYKDFKLDGKIDIIIGEPMGCNIIYDGMLDRMIEARDLFLNDRNGLILPDKIRYKCAFMRDEYQKDEKMDFWDEVYGVTMKEMKKWVSQEPIVRIVDPTLVISEVGQIFEFDLYKVSYEQIDQIKRNVYLKPISSGEVRANGLSIWFEADFRQPDGQVVTIDGSPWSQQTRWSHATLYTRGQWKLEGGVPKKVNFHAKKSHLNGNATIRLKIDSNEEVYVAW